MTTHIVQQLPFGTLFSAPDPVLSLVIVTGQHGDEYAGLEAGAKAIEYVRASLGGHVLTVYNRPGRVSFAPLALDDVTILAVPALNLDGIRHGTRHWNCPEAGRFTRDTQRQGLYGTGTDLNRSWPEHEVVAPVWAAIQALPGPVVVLDFHSSYQDRWGSDGIADHFLFATGRSRAWLETLPVVGKTWKIRDEPASTRNGGPLEDVANAHGYYGVTIELAEDDGVPGVLGCELLAAILAQPPAE